MLDATQPTIAIGNDSPVTVTISDMTVTSSLFGHAAIEADRGTELTLSNVTVTRDAHPGAHPSPGIVVTNGSALTMTDSTVFGAESGVIITNGSSGVIENSTIRDSIQMNLVVGVPPLEPGDEPGLPSTLTLSSSTLTGTTDPEVSLIGLMVGNGTARVTDTDVSQHQVGAAVIVGSLTIEGGSVSDNQFAGVASMYGAATTDIIGTSITGNGMSTGGGFGGGIIGMQDGTISVTGATIAENSAGVLVAGGVLSVTGSVVRDNGSPTDPPGLNLGAGIAAMGGTVSIPEPIHPRISVVDTEVSGNTLGVVAADAGAHISTSTIAGNRLGGVITIQPPQTLTKASPPAGIAELLAGTKALAGKTKARNLRGAAVAVPTGTLLITGSTLANNGGPASTSAFGALAVGAGSLAVIAGSILSSPSGLPPACSLEPSAEPGVIHDGGYNVVSDDSCGLNSGTSLQSTDAELGPLGDNGGASRTMLPATTSPAVDLIPNAAMLAVPDGSGVPSFALCEAGSTDQRGVTRPLGQGCDAGAAEIAPLVAIVTETLPDGTEDESYATTVEATGGDGSPYVWSITDGALPEGLTLNSASGAIEGTPTEAGKFDFTVAVNGDVTKAFSITVAAAPVIPTTPAPTTPAPTTPAPTTPPASATPTPSASSTTSAPATSTAPVVPSATGPNLADTGAGDQSGPGLAVGALALLLGLGLVLIGARRQGEGAHRG